MMLILMGTLSSVVEPHFRDRSAELCVRRFLRLDSKTKLWSESYDNIDS